jgi:hypothetical protein
LWDIKPEGRVSDVAGVFDLDRTWELFNLTEVKRGKSGEINTGIGQ